MTTTAGPQQAPGVAVASFVLGILSIITAGLTAIPAIISGHAARGKILRSNGQFGGGGLAIGGLTMGYVGLVILASVAGAVMFQKGNILDQVGNVAAKECVAHEQEIGRACRAYAADHKGNFPQKLEDLVPQYLQDKTVFRCPMMSGPGQPEMGYRYFGGKNSDPADQVILMSLGTSENLRVLLFVDGTVQTVKDTEVNVQ